MPARAALCAHTVNLQYRIAPHLRTPHTLLLFARCSDLVDALHEGGADSPQQDIYVTTTLRELVLYCVYLVIITISAHPPNPPPPASPPVPYPTPRGGIAGSFEHNALLCFALLCFLVRWHYSTVPVQSRSDGEHQHVSNVLTRYYNILYSILLAFVSLHTHLVVTCCAQVLLHASAAAPVRQLQDPEHAERLHDDPLVRRLLQRARAGHLLYSNCTRTPFVVRLPML